MKPGAILVNTARAGLVDEPALTQAVSSGRLFAALDVHPLKPSPPTYALAAAPNTVLTPYLGYSVRDFCAIYLRQSAENILAFLDGTPIRMIAHP